MFRLRITGGEVADQQAIAARLRGATVEPAVDAKRGIDLAPACDAWAILESRVVDLAAVEKLLAVGKHVLLAADAAISSDWLERLTKAATAGKSRLAICNVERYRPSRQLIRQQLDAGKLGEVGLVRVHRWEPQGQEHGDLSKGLPSDLLDELDGVLAIVGQPPNAIFAVGQFARTVQIHLGFASGAMALVDYNNGLPTGGDYQSLSVIGSSGAAYADDHQNMQLAFRGGQPTALRTDEGVRGLTAMTQEFVDAINQNRDLSAGIAQWRQTLAVASSIHQQLVKGR